MGRAGALDEDDLDALGPKRRDQCLMLIGDAGAVGRLPRLPVPHPARVDQRPGRLVPGIGAHDIPLSVRARA